MCLCPLGVWSQVVSGKAKRTTITVEPEVTVFEAGAKHEILALFETKIYYTISDQALLFEEMN